MTRNEAIERLGGRKRAAWAAGGGCLAILAGALLICGILFGGVSWAGDQVSAWSNSEDAVGMPISEVNCTDNRQMVEPVYRRGEIAGYGCVLDIDAYYVGGKAK